MLQNQGIYNDFSDEFRAELEAKLDSYGNRIRFKFDISNPNPDPLKYNGDIIWPFLYTLDPKTFQIIDTNEKRPGKAKVKRIGVVERIDEKGNPQSFKCVKVTERLKGVLEYDLTVPEQRELAAYLLLHPKLSEGKFQDKGRQPKVSIIDETKLATAQTEIRSAKLIAMNYAAKMSEKEVVEFADAMNWDSTQSPKVLKNRIEELAENTPSIFNDLVNDEKMKYQAVVKQALDNKVINYDPIGNTIQWVSTMQPIAQLSTELDKSEVERAAKWFQLGGDNAQKAFEKVKSLLKQTPANSVK